MQKAALGNFPDEPPTHHKSQTKTSSSDNIIIRVSGLGQPLLRDLVLSFIRYIESESADRLLAKIRMPYNLNWPAAIPARRKRFAVDERQAAPEGAVVDASHLHWSAAPGPAGALRVATRVLLRSSNCSLPELRGYSPDGLRETCAAHPFGTLQSRRTDVPGAEERKAVPGETERDSAQTDCSLGPALSWLALVGRGWIWLATRRYQVPEGRLASILSFVPAKIKSKVIRRGYLQNEKMRRALLVTRFLKRRSQWNRIHSGCRRSEGFPNRGNMEQSSNDCQASSPDGIPETSAGILNPAEIPRPVLHAGPDGLASTGSIPPAARHRSTTVRRLC
jgi:hypothetical protein